MLLKCFCFVLYSSFKQKHYNYIYILGVHASQSIAMPPRLELHTENNKPQLVFMDQIEEIGTDLVTVGIELHHIIFLLM